MGWLGKPGKRLAEQLMCGGKTETHVPLPYKAGITNYVFHMVQYLLDFRKSSKMRIVSEPHTFTYTFVKQRQAMNKTKPVWICTTPSSVITSPNGRGVQGLKNNISWAESSKGLLITPEKLKIFFLKSISIIMLCTSCTFSITQPKPVLWPAVS